MEFRFNVNRLLPRKINKISHTLIPEDFRGDRRELNECQRLLSRVLEEMGEASARAQGLSKPITSAQKLRDTDHLVYLLVDSEGNNGYGSVVGLLKTGSKNLFMFDENGLHYQLQPRCILDFYVHETKQRMGLGNVLYQHMLAEENTRPVKLAIDRPSENFLQFLRKHYGLESVIPQNNNFVVFRGFFEDEIEDPRLGKYSLSSRGSLDGGAGQTNNNNQEIGNKNCRMPSSVNPPPYSGMSRSAYGRYAAARPPCSMANIIHNNSGVLGQQATERTGETQVSAMKLERPRSLSLYSEEERKHRTGEIVSTVPAMTLNENRSAPIYPRDKGVSASGIVDRPPSRPDKRATSAAFGPLVNHHRRETATEAFSTMNIRGESEPTEKPSSGRTSIDSANPERRSAEKVSSASTIRNNNENEVSNATGNSENTSEKPPNSALKRQSSTFSSFSISSLDREDSARKEKPPSANGAVKASPSCAQEVGGNQSAHLDLKFYHSPLW